MRKKAEIAGQKVKVLEIIEKLRLDNPRLINALDNDLFIKIIYEIVNLPYELHLNDERSQGVPQIMTSMIKFEYTLSTGGKPIVWIHYPTSPKSKSILCRLQKHKYSSTKVIPPSKKDIEGYYSFRVKNEEDIKDLISCINEYMN